MRHSEMTPQTSRGTLPAVALLLLLVLTFLGCRTAPPLPPADISTPNWRLQQGQAVWKPTRSRPELAGELLLATRTNGDFFVQFSKTPFNLATAQMMDGQWQIEFGNGERRWTGRGKPPSRFAWFQLPHAIAGEELNRNWRFTRIQPDSWRLENPRTGESLEGGFFP
jgi:hypothetical protein